MEIENTEALQKDQLKAGDRVAAVVDADPEKEVITLYGYGVYEGEEISGRSQCEVYGASSQ
jgi:hypothetical protein